MIVQASDRGFSPLTDTTTVYITVTKKESKSDIVFTGGAVLVHTDAPDIVTTVDSTTQDDMRTMDVTTPPPVTTPLRNVYAPVFRRRSYTWTVPEDAEIGSLVAVAMATDDDDGVSGEIIYAIEPDDVEEFTIDTESGMVTEINEKAIFGDLIYLKYSSESC